MTYMLRFILLLSMLLFPLKMYDDMQMPDVSEIQCLATVVYWEARGESNKGQLAVASVVLNRSVKRDKSICDIMSEKGQFSWYRKHPELLPFNVVDKQAHLVYDVYMQYVNGRHEDHSKGATHFTVSKVRNEWTRKYRRVMIEGRHSFYEER